MNQSIYVQFTNFLTSLIFIYLVVVVMAVQEQYQHRHHRPDQAPLAPDTFTDMNRKHWDQAASTYNSEQWQKDIMNKTHAFILSNMKWISADLLDPSTAFEKAESTTRQVRVLDYACGPGTITGALQGYASEFVGVDVSENMVKAYNERFAESDQRGEASTRNAEAFVGDLLDGRGPSDSVSGPGFFGFDLAVVGYGFHHFGDLNLATSRLASRLKPGGVLFIVDFVTHAKVKDDDPSKNTIAHHGFGEDEVNAIFLSAGLVDIGVMEMEGTIEIKKRGAREDEPEQKRQVFLARGRKPT